MKDDIEPIKPLPLPFRTDEKIFQHFDEETGEAVGEPYCYDDFMNEIISISGVSELK